MNYGRFLFLGTFSEFSVLSNFSTMTKSVLIEFLKNLFFERERGIAHYIASVAHTQGLHLCSCECNKKVNRAWHQSQCSGPSMLLVPCWAILPVPLSDCFKHLHSALKFSKRPFHLFQDENWDYHYGWLQKSTKTSINIHSPLLPIQGQPLKPQALEVHAIRSFAWKFSQCSFLPCFGDCTQSFMTLIFWSPPSFPSLFLLSLGWLQFPHRWAIEYWASQFLNCSFKDFAPHPPGHSLPWPWPCLCHYVWNLNWKHPTFWPPYHIPSFQQTLL